ncbi:MAG: PKD domain-containing protein, partial [Actinomycetota bacterium]|nr:PKD domain-containing protein [Actinomycetota bacterium]
MSKSKEGQAKILRPAVFLAAALMLLVLATQTFAAWHEVSGELPGDTTWTQAGGPYQITEDLIVPLDVTLTIDPGTEVLFDPETNIRVNGTLIARGLADSAISFTSDTNDAYKETIIFAGESHDASYTPGGAYVNGSIIERAGLQGVSVEGNAASPYLHRLDVKGAKVSALLSDMRINDSTFTDSPDGGVVLNNVINALVENNRFVNSKVKGTGSSSATIDGNDFYRSHGISTKDTASPVPYLYTYVIKNNILREDYDGIEASAKAETGYAGTTTVENNLIYRFVGSDHNPILADAITGSSATATVVVRNNVVAENNIKNTYASKRVAGIRTTTTKGSNSALNILVGNNTVVNNSLNTTTTGPARSFGILADGDNGTFSRNTVVGNQSIDVYQQGYGGLAQGDSGNLYDPWGNNSFERNNVFGNFLPYGTPMYNLFNEEDSGISAINSYWGTTDTITVGLRIYDSADWPYVGPVTYEPFLSQADPEAPIPPPLNFRSDPENGKLYLTWDRVNATDTTGYKVYYDTDDSSFPYEGSDAAEGASPIDVGDTTGTVLTGLTAGRTYHVAVTAIDGDYNDGLSTLQNQLAGHESWYSRLVEDKPWPIANFNADLAPYAQVGQVVSFNNASLGTVNSWVWDFGDGQTSIEENPTHTYTWQDRFTVSLTVTGPAGTDTEIKQGYIETGKPPETIMTLVPSAPNGDNDWYIGSAPQVRLRPDETATVVRWRWDSPSGSWSQATNVYPNSYAAVTALEGERTLYYYSIDLSNTTETSAPKSGVIKVDTHLPTNPSVSSPSHTVNGWSTDRTIDISLTGAADTAGGSAVDGFNYAWSQDPVFIPDPVKFREENMNAVTSGELANGPWYFHIRTKDNAGNWASTAHKGPYGIDTVAPTGTIAIKGGAAITKSPYVTLNLSVADGAGSGGGQMRFKNDGGSWSSWRNYAATTSWSLVTGDGD